MGMLTAMFAGVAGLNSHGTALSSVADNISNINTSGYKASRVNFGDVMVQALSMGGTLANQVGTGSRVLTVQNLMTQGSFESTDVNTDLAINGAGFFMVSDPDTSTTGTATSGYYYTRAGEFLLDSEGYMVNTQGYRLVGFNVDSNGNLEQTAESLRLVTQQTDAEPTSQVDMSVNLDASDDDKHHPSEGIDPTDTDTYNYMNTVTVYDSLGIAHDIAMIYQRLSSYDGTVPTNTASSWKVGAYEIDSDGNLTANPPFPDNTFYTHFDTDGQLLGTSTGQPAYGDMYTSTATVAASTSNVSDQMGESFTYTSEGVTQSIYTTGTVTFGAATAGTETVTIGTDTYTMGVNATSALAAQDLADQVNSSATAGYYATVAGSVVTLYSRQTSSTAYDVTSSDANITTADETTMAGMETLIDNARAATGMVNIGSAANGDEVAINGFTYTYTTGVPGANEFSNATQLAALINGDSGGVLTATAFGTDNVTIAYDTSGTAGNAVVLDNDPNSTNTGSIYTSASTLLNGLDDSTATFVDASVVASGSGYALRLSRTDTGAAATITMGTSNTLGDNLSLDFDNFTQDQHASAAQSTSSVETQGQRTLTYDFTDATPDQEITFDFVPSDTSASTQSAGDYDTFYLHQDGSPRGTLESLNIDSDGYVTGQFNNGTLVLLGAVALTNVANPSALKRQGQNLWAWTRDAGDPLPPSRPGSSGLGSLESGALEQSNVDLADQFVKMINYQRAFQANTKTISTTDSMLAELINLKR